MSTLNIKISEDPRRNPWAVDTETFQVTAPDGASAVLLGFSATDDAATVDLSCSEWVANPEAADGMYPVVRSTAGEGVLPLLVIGTEAGPIKAEGEGE